MEHFLKFGGGMFRLLFERLTHIVSTAIAISDKTDNFGKQVLRDLRSKFESTKHQSGFKFAVKAMN